MYFFKYIQIGLTRKLFIDVPVPSQDSERSCTYVLGISILPVSTIFRLYFGTILIVLCFLLFILLF